MANRSSLRVNLGYKNIRVPEKQQYFYRNFASKISTLRLFRHTTGLVNRVARTSQVAVLTTLTARLRLQHLTVSVTKTMKLTLQSVHIAPVDILVFSWTGGAFADFVLVLPSSSRDKNNPGPVTFHAIGAIVYNVMMYV